MTHICKLRRTCVGCTEDDLLDWAIMHQYSLSVVLVLVTAFCLAVSSSELVPVMEDGTCLPWTYRQTATSPCQCGNVVQGVILCNTTSRILTIQMCTCMTYDPQTT